MFVPETDGILSERNNPVRVDTSQAAGDANGIWSAIVHFKKI
jgi:hypothetical protein